MYKFVVYKHKPTTQTLFFFLRSRTGTESFVLMMNDKVGNHKCILTLGKFSFNRHRGEGRGGRKPHPIELTRNSGSC